MRRLIAIFALVGLVTSPVVARTRLFCKYTGVEITDCSELEAPPLPVLSRPGCCDHRLFSPLPASKVSPDWHGELVPVIVAEAPAQVVSLATPFVASSKRPPVGAGPPLFVQHRSLLI